VLQHPSVERFARDIVEPENLTKFVEHAGCLILSSPSLSCKESVRAACTRGSSCSGRSKMHAIVTSIGGKELPPLVGGIGSILSAATSPVRERCRHAISLVVRALMQVLREALRITERGVQSSLQFAKSRLPETHVRRQSRRPCEPAHARTAQNPTRPDWSSLVRRRRHQVVEKDPAVLSLA
jgi:hypothetical protein